MIFSDYPDSCFKIERHAQILREVIQRSEGEDCERFLARAFDDGRGDCADGAVAASHSYNFTVTVDGAVYKFFELLDGPCNVQFRDESCLRKKFFQPRT